MISGIELGPASLVGAEGVFLNVTKFNDMYKASRITGPKHNDLGLVLSRTPSMSKPVLSRTLNNETAVIDERQLVAAVVAGIEEANHSTEAPLHAPSIQYVSSDTPDYSAYSQLAKAIALKASEDFA